MTFLHPEAVAAAKRHALEAYPQESVGFVLGDDYVRATNVHANPTEEFEVGAEEYLRALADPRGLKAMLHSHPEGPLFPNEADMVGQISGDIVWGIIATDGERVSDPYLWGDALPIAPLLGREFHHGISDCFSAFRDVFRLGAEGLDAQGIENAWPHGPITLREMPRNDGWWEPENGGQNLYQEFYEEWGFVKIDKTEARAGDGFLIDIGSKGTLNHIACLITNDTILHQLPQRLCRREPAGIWARAARMWVRYVGPGSSIKADGSPA